MPVSGNFYRALIFIISQNMRECKGGRARFFRHPQGNIRQIEQRKNAVHEYTRLSPAPNKTSARPTSFPVIQRAKITDSHSHTPSPKNLCTSCYDRVMSVVFSATQVKGTHFVIPNSLQIYNLCRFYIKTFVSNLQPNRHDIHGHTPSCIGRAQILRAGCWA